MQNVSKKSNVQNSLHELNGAANLIRTLNGNFASLWNSMDFPHFPADVYELCRVWIKKHLSHREKIIVSAEAVPSATHLAWNQVRVSSNAASISP